MDLEVICAAEMDVLIVGAAEHGLGSHWRG